MNALTSLLIRLGLLKEDLDYQLLRASMIWFRLVHKTRHLYECTP